MWDSLATYYELSRTTDHVGNPTTLCDRMASSVASPIAHPTAIRHAARHTDRAASSKHAIRLVAAEDFAHEANLKSLVHPRPYSRPKTARGDDSDSEWDDDDDDDEDLVAAEGEFACEEYLQFERESFFYGDRVLDS